MTAPKPEGRLSPREAAFVAWYVVLNDGAEAARRAGYSPKAAKEQAYQMRKTPRVATAIEAAQAEIAARMESAREDVIDGAAAAALRWIDEIDALAHSNIRHYVLDDHGDVALRDGAPEDAWRAVQSVELEVKKDGTRKTKLRLWSKTEALRQKGEHLGLFKQKIELSGSVSTPPSRLSESERTRMLREFLAERGN